MFQCCTNASSQAKSEPLRFPALQTLLQIFSGCRTTSLRSPQPSRAAVRQPQPGQDYKLMTQGQDLVLLLWRQLVVNFLWKLLSAVVGQVGPDDLFLGEAEDTKPTAFQGVVYNVSRVSQYFLSFKDSAKRMCTHIQYPYFHLSLIRPILGRWMSNQR